MVALSNHYIFTYTLKHDSSYSSCIIHHHNYFISFSNTIINQFYKDYMFIFKKKIMIQQYLGRVNIWKTEKTLFVIITSGFVKHLCDVIKSFCKTFNLLKSGVKLKANLCSRVQSQFSHSRVVLDRKLSNPLLNLNYWIFKLIFSNRTQSMFDYFPKHMTYLILSACTHFQISLMQKPRVTPPHLFNQIYDPFAP